MTRDEILLAKKEYLFPALFHYYDEPLVVSHAQDQWLFDIDGNRYLDFFGGILTVSVGHCNREVNARVHEQLDRLQHVSTVYVTEPLVQLAKKVAEVAPGELRQSMWTNSGTEANETAVIAARCYTGSSEMVALRHSYHGRSNLAMGLTGHATWRNGGAPQPGFVLAHNAYCYRCPFGLTYPSCEVRCAQDVEDLIRTSTSGRVAGAILEPIQGVGGFITPPKEYFGIVAGIVRKYGGVVISDEVQTAWGRTGGRWFGMEHWGVEPDIVTSAKGLGNGTPIGMTLARPEIAAKSPNPTISTFGGNPVTATQARAVIEYIERQNLLANAADTGAYLREGLEDLATRHASIGEVRGMGLMQALELVEDRTTRQPGPVIARRLMEATRRNGILVGRGGLHSNCIRISPPLNISRADVAEFLGLLDRSFEEMDGRT